MLNWWGQGFVECYMGRERVINSEMLLWLSKGVVVECYIGRGHGVVL